MAWERTARTLPIFQQQTLSNFPMGGVFAPVSNRVLLNQFASADLIYVLSRAGSFFSKLWPQQKVVYLADMSNAKGETPSVGGPGDRIYRHPLGSHTNGQDVDIPYIKIWSSTSIDFEANFWLVYGLLQNTGVDLIITAFKSEFIAMAHQAYKQGLINHIALARLDSSRMLVDQGLGHDDHLHALVRNGDNDGLSKKFALADNVYNCYLKLKPGGRGAGGNFCDVN